MSVLATLALAAQLAAPAATASAELRGEALMHALRAGGYTILLRHARTDRSYQEPMGAVPATRAEQRNLSADGVRDAALMGAVLRRYRVPIGEIVSSPMYRTRETAEMAAGGPAELTMALRVIPSTDEQAALVAKAPARGTNRLLVTHHFVIERHVPGIRPGDIAESEAVVLKSAPGGGIALVGRILLRDWETLAGVTPSPNATSPAATTPASNAVPAAHLVPGIHAALPETPAARLARGYVEAFNSGDTTRMRAFIESSLVPNPDRTTEARLASYVQTLERFGSLSVHAVRASAPNEIVLDIKARPGDFVLTVTESPERPGRASAIRIGTLQGGHP